MTRALCTVGIQQSKQIHEVRVMQYPNGNSSRPFSASHYKVTTYQKCPRLYYFEYLDDQLSQIKRDIKKPRPELEVGNAVHIALCNYYKIAQDKRDFKALKQLLIQVWKPSRGSAWGFTDIEEERVWFHEALLMLKTFYDHQFDEDHLFYVPDPQSREEFIKIPMDADLQLIGKVDRIDEDGDGLHVIDYKTGKSQNDDDFQVMIYVLLAQEKFGKQVKKASYFYLRTGYMKTYSPTTGDAKVTAEKVRRLVQTIKTDTKFEAKPTKLCAWCDYLDYCPKKAEAMAIINGTAEIGVSDSEEINPISI